MGNPSTDGLIDAAPDPTHAGPDPAILADLVAHGYDPADAAKLAANPEYVAACAMGAAQQRERETLPARRARFIAELRPASPRERLTEARRIAREIAENDDHPLALAHPQQQRAALAHACREVARHHATVRRSATIRSPRQLRRPGVRRAHRTPRTTHAPPGGDDPGGDPDPELAAGLAGQQQVGPLQREAGAHIDPIARIGVSR
jgi:hypothetical protein